MLLGVSMGVSRCKSRCVEMDSSLKSMIFLSSFLAWGIKPNLFFFAWASIDGRQPSNTDLAKMLSTISRFLGYMIGKIEIANNGG